MNLFQRLLEWLFGGRATVSVDREIAWTGYVKPTMPKPKPASYGPHEFLDAIKPHAQAIERDFGIPWTFAATQAAHESRWGNSRLTLEANNLFGVTGDSWVTQDKPVYWIETKEFVNGEETTIRRPFRKYDDWTGSLRDWAELLARRYGGAMEAARAGDFPGFAEGLVKGGYATDPRYAPKLVALYRATVLSTGDTPPKSNPGASGVA